jgi:hypothetical protein
MAVYALSGVLLIFRDTNFLKRTTHVKKVIEPNLSEKSLGEALKIRRFKVGKVQGDTLLFKNGYYVKSSGETQYKTVELPFVINKMNHLHKAKKGDPLYYLNVFFGVSLLFFVLSSFWMFLPKTTIFKKGLYYTAAGIVLTLVMLLV